MSATATSHTESIIYDLQSDLPTRPVISDAPVDQIELKRICPAHAIGVNPVRIDLGRCNFCRECARKFSSKIRFTDDVIVSSNVRDRLVVLEGEEGAVTSDVQLIRDEVGLLSEKPLRLFLVESDALPLDERATAIRQRFDVTFVSSATEAHGIVLLSETTETNFSSLRQWFDMLLPPRLVILAGTAAINSGVHSDNRQSGKRIIDRFPADLYVPGRPVHAATLAIAVRELIKIKINTPNNIK
jgi:Ni,Fe-hydrogenase III small subunit